MTINQFVHKDSFGEPPVVQIIAEDIKDMIKDAYMKIQSIGSREPNEINDAVVETWQYQIDALTELYNKITCKPEFTEQRPPVSQDFCEHCNKAFLEGDLRITSFRSDKYGVIYSGKGVHRDCVWKMKELKIAEYESKNSG